MWKGFAVAGGVLLLGGAVLVALALRPPELAPASGSCPDCGTVLNYVAYGLRGIPRSTSLAPIVERVSVDGTTFDLERLEDGKLLLWGGCVIPPSETGAVCLRCRRTWVLDWDAMGMPRGGDGFLWRLRGGLLRLL